ncbi:MAG: hypothetical protein M3281_10215 [Chloroflexota bacterium]|nr:hypothetical protein [Chloroflexota bacterium]
MSKLTRQIVTAPTIAVLTTRVPRGDISWLLDALGPEVMRCRRGPDEG